ncbi:hypothetical protein Tcan_15020 [Toxocara canis]|uniref:Uncharacterized protein n=1 Tax=Toxocara canis TaxID=6265 RepID=A0A0B2UM42_TOXCA|nr:hypothetical protein Tcan_15020 [Toxocara canis]
MWWYYQRNIGSEVLPKKHRVYLPRKELDRGTTISETTNKATLLLKTRLDLTMLVRRQQIEQTRIANRAHARRITFVCCDERKRILKKTRKRGTREIRKEHRKGGDTYAFQFVPRSRLTGFTTVNRAAKLSLRVFQC